VESMWPAWRPTHLRVGEQVPENIPAARLRAAEGSGGVEDVLVDGGATVHLVWGDEPFVGAGGGCSRRVRGSGSTSCSGCFGDLGGGLVERHEGVGPAPRRSRCCVGNYAVDEGVIRHSSLLVAGRHCSQKPLSMSPCHGAAGDCLPCYSLGALWCGLSGQFRWGTGVNAGRWLAFPLEWGRAQAVDWRSIGVAGRRSFQDLEFGPAASGYRQFAMPWLRLRMGMERPWRHRAKRRSWTYQPRPLGS